MGVKRWSSGIPKGLSVSGDVRLSDEGGVAVRLVAALATLTAQVKPGTFAVIGGLAVMTRLRSVHRITDDIDGVTEQLGDDPSDVAIVLGESGRSGVRRLIDGVKIDHIDVSDTPADQIQAEDLPEDEWDRAFVLSHRWGLDSATAVTISAVRKRLVVATVTCLAASPASLVTMKLQPPPADPSPGWTRLPTTTSICSGSSRTPSSFPTSFVIWRYEPPTTLAPGRSSGSALSSPTAPTTQRALFDEADRPTS